MKLWKDMTPEEKGALLLAYHEGKVIEWCYGFCEPSTFRVDGSSAKGGMEPCWDPKCYYRVKPEPKEPREFWLVNSEAFTSEWAAKQARDVRGGRIVHVREVLE